ncbi:MAG: EAL domain-containing protein, partial [Campylobacterota bacterium]|nr:EAL domain-containing protein [Campylobacterota bacterium]
MKLTKNIITSIMANEDYGVCYEPIVDVKSMQTVAYEALSRFKNGNKNIAPNIFFKSLHEDLELFFYMESIIKKFQIDNRPKDKKLFLNLDPDIAIKQTHVFHWIDLFSLDEDIVIEVIENSNDENIEHIEYFIDWMKEYKIKFAYDDLLKPNCLFIDSILKDASILKFDINFIQTVREDKAYMEIVKGYVNYANKSNKQTIMEGIETENDLEIAKEIGVCFVQGYLFKDKFIKHWKNQKNVSAVNPSKKIDKPNISASLYHEDNIIDYEIIEKLGELESEIT